MSCCCQSHPVPVEAAPCRESGNGSEWAVLGVLILLSGLAMNVSLAVNLSFLEGTTRLLAHGGLAVAGIAAFMLGGADLLRPAWVALRERRVVTEHLFLAGIAAAWAVSLHATLTGQGAVFYEVPILLPAIRRFGSILLGRQQRNIESAVRDLLAGVATARVWKAGGWLALPLSSVEVGDRLLIKAGETIPANAIIVAGQAYIQTGALTGEPFPITLETGARVSSGMVPLDGDLEVKVSTVPAASDLSQIASSTRTLLEHPPAFLRSVDSVLRWFFPAVLVVSVVTCGFWAWHDNWQAAISHSLAVVLVACPCAFGMALPLLFRRGLASCLQRGIEPADAGFMESLSLVKVIAFDKTGTLTVPEMSVTSLVCAPAVEEKTVRALLAAIHRCSSHPVARPFWRWAAEADDLKVRGLHIRPGRGVDASVRLYGTWQPVRLGHESFLSNPPPEWAKGSKNQRRLFVEIGGKFGGVCLLAEQLRSSAAATCRTLGAGGWRTTILTGDAAVPGDLAASVDEIHVSQRPSDKAKMVTLWEHAAKAVLFIGDGLNDAPALAAASASIAVGDGPAFAAASAHARWQNPDFAALPSLLDEARGLAARARLILRTALTYNILGMTIAAAGWLHPVAAAALMLVSSATVMALAARPLPRPRQTATALKLSFRPVAL